MHEERRELAQRQAWSSKKNVSDCFTILGTCWLVQEQHATRLSRGDHICRRVLRCGGLLNGPQEHVEPVRTDKNARHCEHNMQGLVARGCFTRLVTTPVDRLLERFEVWSSAEGEGGVQYYTWRTGYLEGSDPRCESGLVDSYCSSSGFSFNAGRIGLGGLTRPIPSIGLYGPLGWVTWRTAEHCRHLGHG